MGVSGGRHYWETLIMIVQERDEEPQNHGCGSVGRKEKTDHEGIFTMQNAQDIMSDCI